jgi:CTP:molybdopterin cytidylyltransferase MocA
MRSNLPEKVSGLAAIVLAAGGSSRLGAPKQLLRGGTEPLIVRALMLATRAGAEHTVVVVGAERQRLRSTLRRHGLTPEVAANASWRTGLASSLRTGLERVRATAAGALILLVDQPRVDVSDLTRLVAHWHRRPSAPAAAFYSGHAGAPAILPQRCFRAAMSLEGDVGARGLLRNLGEVTLVPMPQAAFDVDTPDDAERLRTARHGQV